MALKEFWHFQINIHLKQLQESNNLETDFTATVSEILGNHSERFFNQNCRKR